ESAVGVDGGVTRHFYERAELRHGRARGQSCGTLAFNCRCFGLEWLCWCDWIHAWFLLMEWLGPRASGRLLCRVPPHHRRLMRLAAFVVGDPFAHLLSPIEPPGAHLRSVFAIPLPVAVHLAVFDGALAPNRSVFVILRVFGELGLGSHG